VRQSNGSCVAHKSTYPSREALEQAALEEARRRYRAKIDG
jgi:hypothetical protein